MYRPRNQRDEGNQCEDGGEDIGNEYRTLHLKLLE